MFSKTPKQIEAEAVVIKRAKSKILKTVSCMSNLILNSNFDCGRKSEYYRFSLNVSNNGDDISLHIFHFECDQVHTDYNEGVYFFDTFTQSYRHIDEMVNIMKENLATLERMKQKLNYFVRRNRNSNS